MCMMCVCVCACVYLCLHTQEGEIQDAVVCRITDNPEPVVFPISVIGSKPIARVRLDDGSPDPYAADPAAAAAAAVAAAADAAKPKTPPKGGKGGSGDSGPVNKLLQEGMVFERLLVGKQETQHMLISNPGEGLCACTHVQDTSLALHYTDSHISFQYKSKTCACKESQSTCCPECVYTPAGLLPIQWKLTGADSLPPELKVYPSSGRLEARQDVRVSVEFTSIEKREVSHKLSLDVCGVEEGQPLVSSTPIQIKGEGYKMEVDVKFPQVRVSVCLCVCVYVSVRACVYHICMVNQTGSFGIACQMRACVCVCVYASTGGSGLHGLRHRARV